MCSPGVTARLKAIAALVKPRAIARGVHCQSTHRAQVLDGTSADDLQAHARPSFPAPAKAARQSASHPGLWDGMRQAREGWHDVPINVPYTGCRERTNGD